MAPKIKVVSVPYWDPQLPTSENENHGVTAAPRKIFKAFERLEKAGVHFCSWSGGSYELEWDYKLEQKVIQDPKEIIQRAIKQLDTACPLFLGGDHALTNKIISQLSASFGKNNIGLIYLDAHPDAKLSSRKLHARWMAVCILEELVLRNRILLLGSRAEEMGPETQFLGKNKIAVMRMQDFVTNSREEWSLALYNILARWHKPKPLVHLSIDIDVLDPSEAPGTLHRASGGMRLADHLLPALNVIQTSGVRVVSMDLVEISPRLDPTEDGVHTSLTINAALSIIRELAALFGKE